MMTGTLRLFTAVLCTALLSACKLTIEVPEGGYVQSSSGNYDCRPEAEAASVQSQGHHGHMRHTETIQPQHEEAFHCDIDVSDVTFDETFTAVAEEGYEFSHWKKAPRSFFGDRETNPVRLTTTIFVGFEQIAAVLDSDIGFYLEPVFVKSIKTGDVSCENFSGSFERIQELVFERTGCTNSACHGGGASAGGLDLRADVAYDNLLRVMSTANLAQPLQRVYPGEQKNSFLYLKMEAATNGTSLPSGGGQAMPIGFAPLSANQLEAVRLWIRNGAPENADVDDVATLLGCDTATEPTANKIAPPDPPPVGEGVQFVSGPWTVAPNSENEVCFATYYDLEQTPEYLPEWAKTDCVGGVFSDYDGSCMASNSRTLTQDPQSHHSIIDVYVGSTSPFDPSWGEWQCLNGPSAGMACDPTRIGEPVADGGADCGGRLYACGTPAEKSLACTGWGPGDRIYKSVQMGGAQSPISSETYSEGVYATLPTRGVITWNSHAFNLSDEPTSVEQYNEFLFAPADQRDYRNRSIFDIKDIFVANVPPYEQRTYCSTYTLPVGSRLTQLSSHAHKRGILFQTWLPPQDPSCKVSTMCEPNEATADYVSRIYNDPLYLDYQPPLAYDSDDPADRTMKFCVTYDNGQEYPELLKRNSTSVGTTCEGKAYCAGGATPGLSCGSDDSVCGDGGQCDACAVRGGVTTEDEMFILLGSFYQVPPAERNSVD